MADHRAAVLAALRANTNLLAVYDGSAPIGVRPPYVVVYVYLPSERRSTLNGGTDWTNVTVITHAVGASHESSYVVAKQVRLALLDQRLSVTDSLCSRIEHAVGHVPTYDESTGALLSDAVDQWDYYAIPA